MTTPEQVAQACTSCAADPNAAPNRTCAPRRCYCHHATCHAADSQRAEPLAGVIYLPQPRGTT